VKEPGREKAIGSTGRAPLAGISIIGDLENAHELPFLADRRTLFEASSRAPARPARAAVRPAVGMAPRIGSPAPESWTGSTLAVQRPGHHMPEPSVTSHTNSALPDEAEQDRSAPVPAPPMPGSGGQDAPAVAAQPVAMTNRPATTMIGPAAAEIDLTTTMTSSAMPGPAAPAPAPHALTDHIPTAPTPAGMPPVTPKGYDLDAIIAELTERLNDAIIDLGLDEEV
jgi:hypothetical protein